MDVQGICYFQGLETEDSDEHVKVFLRLWDTFKLSGVPQDAIRSIVFPFSLRGQAMSWYDAIEGSTITIFKELRKFVIIFLLLSLAS